MLMQTIFPMDSRLSNRDGNDCISANTPIVRNENPLDQYFFRGKSCFGAANRQEDDRARFSHDTAQTSANDCSFGVFPIGSGDSMLSTRGKVRRRESVASHEPRMSFESQYNREHWTYKESRQIQLPSKSYGSSDSKTVSQDNHNSGVLAGEEMSLMHMISTNQDEEINQYHDTRSLDGETWVADEAHPSSPMTGQSRKHADSFLDLIEESLASHSGSGVFGIHELSYFLENDPNDGEEAKSLVLNAPPLVPLTTTSNALKEPRCNKRIKTRHSCDNADDNSSEIDHLLQQLKLAMNKSKSTQQSLQEWDRKNGLPASHCQTMVNSSRSREQLRSGMVLQKWNGVPLLMLPGARLKVTRRQFRGVQIAEIE